MRKKIARRKRRELLKLGCTIGKIEYEREPGWKRSDCGYSITVYYKGWKICCIGFDELVCYKMALETVYEDMKDPFLEDRRGKESEDGNRE